MILILLLYPHPWCLERPTSSPASPDGTIFGLPSSPSWQSLESKTFCRIPSHHSLTYHWLWLKPLGYQMTHWMVIFSWKPSIWSINNFEPYPTLVMIWLIWKFGRICRRQMPYLVRGGSSHRSSLVGLSPTLFPISPLNGDLLTRV